MKSKCCLCTWHPFIIFGRFSLRLWFLIFMIKTKYNHWKHFRTNGYLRAENLIRIMDPKCLLCRNSSYYRWIGILLIDILNKGKCIIALETFLLLRAQNIIWNYRTNMLKSIMSRWVSSADCMSLVRRSLGCRSCI